MYKHSFDTTILRSYDIRGIFGKTLDKKDAFMLGFFYGITVKNNNPKKNIALNARRRKRGVIFSVP